MKTQIATLRSGRQNQILNSEIDYTQLPKSSSHIGHSGSNQNDVNSIWNKVILENQEKMRITIKGIEIELTANWSISGKSVSYWGTISKDDLENIFSISSAKNEQPTISIHDGNLIEISNGKNSYRYICPSLITIL